jgi:peptidyl-prolyl cis-trans isomerase B (cyclophilin B)
VASSNKRERDLARAHYEAQQQRKAEESAGRRKRQQVIAAVVVLAVILGGVVWFVASNRSTGGEDAAAPVASNSPSPSDAPSESPSESSSAAPVECKEPAEVTTKSQTWPDPPADKLDPKSTYRIDLDTNCGTVVIESDPDLVKAAPQTVNSQIFLSNEKFFDNADCFRLTTAGIFVLQCGSPNNDGTGGPGYTIPDENLPADEPDNYPAGTVAMANSGPDTNGSQFYVVTGDQGVALPASYSLFGKVIEGLDVVQAIEATGSEEGTPSEETTITSVSITEG